MSQPIPRSFSGFWLAFGLVFSSGFFPVHGAHPIKFERMSQARRITLLSSLILIGCISSATLHAQAAKADINARLQNKPLFLRGCWNGAKLHFDSTGKLLDKAEPVSITLCGFDLDRVHLENQTLVLEGRRSGLELDKGKQKRVKLPFTLAIEIAAPPNSDYGPALDAIFVENLAEMVPSLPFYWQDYAQKHFLPQGAATAAEQNLNPPAEIRPVKTGDKVTPPTPLKTVAPLFNPAARAQLYGGKVVVGLSIQTDGSVADLSIVRAVGLGLDENALAAVQQYKFAPATKDGKPVKVKLFVEVNFNVR